MSVDIRQLRYFVAIIDRGSFSRAASFLNVAQPALSHHVRNMETMLGAQLLVRGPRGVTATETGGILARHARIILNQLVIAEEEIRGNEAEPAGEVRLGLPGTISEILSVPLITEVSACYPGIRLRIAEAMSGFVLEWMRRGRIDLGVIYRDVVDDGLSTTHLLDEELFFFGPPDSGFADEPPPGSSIAFTRTTHYPLIVPGVAHGLRKLLDTEADRAGISLTPAVEVDAYSNIKALVAGGFGYSFLPLNAIKREVACGAVRHWRITGPEIQRTLHLAFSVERPMTNAAAAVVSSIHDILQRLSARGDWTGVSNLACGTAPRRAASIEPEASRISVTPSGPSGEAGKVSCNGTRSPQLIQESP